MITGRKITKTSVNLLMDFNLDNDDIYVSIHIDTITNEMSIRVTLCGISKVATVKLSKPYVKEDIRCKLHTVINEVLNNINRYRGEND
jgi:hypothetical protein